MLSKWPVVMTVPLTDPDVETDGTLTEHGAARVFAAAQAEYFDTCVTVAERDVDVQELTVLRRGAQVGLRVSVSVGVVELYDDRMVMRGRIRPADDDGIAADVQAVLATAGPLTKEMRDEFIDRARNARFSH